MELAASFSVGEVAAAQTPGGAGDLGGEVFFEDVDGFEGVVHIDDEHVVDFGLCGEDEICLSVQARCDGVAGGGVEPFGAVRSGAFGRIFSVGFHLSFCCHG